MTRESPWYNQMWCYANMYIRNRRVLDLLRLVVSHRSLAVEVMWGFVRQRTSEWAAMLRPRQVAVRGPR